MLLQGMKPEDQIGYFDGFQQQVAKGNLSSFDAIPYRGLGSQLEWTALWRDVTERISSSGPSCLFLQYFHMPGIPDPRPYLQAIKLICPGTVIVTSIGDPFDPVWNRPPRSLVRAASLSDLVLTTSMGRLARWLKRSGAERVSLFPNSACSVRFGGDLMPEQSAHQIVFIGSRYLGRNPSRVHWRGGRQRDHAVKQLAKRYGLEFAVYGLNWEGLPSWQGPCNFADQVRVASRAQVVFGGIPGSSLPYYSSNRAPIQMLSAKPLVDMCVPGLRNLFGSEESLRTFTTVKEAMREIDVLLENPDKAVEVGHSARSRVRNHHMSRQRTETFCEWVQLVSDAKLTGRDIEQPASPFIVDTSRLPEPTSLGW